MTKNKIFWVLVLIGANFNTHSIYALDLAKKEIKIALAAEPPNLNHMKAVDSVSSTILNHLMEGLVRIDVKGKVIPGIAQKWQEKKSSQTTEIIFYLRKNIFWHDGKALTAHDFVFSWRKVLDPQTASEAAYFFYPIKNAKKINTEKMDPKLLGVEALGDSILKVTLEAPCPYFVSLTAMVNFFPMREDFYARQGDSLAAEASLMLFNGPFLLTKWEHGSALRLVKNERYWNKNKTKLNVIDIPFVLSDSSARLNFFRDHKIDFIDKIVKEKLGEVQKEKIKLEKFNDGSLWYFEFNMRSNRVLSNKNLRLAIKNALNITEYVNKVIAIPGSKAAYTFVNSSIRGFKKTFLKEYPPARTQPNLKVARQYLALALRELEANKLLRPGQELALTYLTDDTPSATKEAEYWQSAFKKNLGINIKIDKQIFKQRLSLMSDGKFDIVQAGWSADYNDPMAYAELKLSNNPNNNGKYLNKTYDTLLEEAARELDLQKRFKLIAQALQLLSNDAAVLPLYERSVVYAVNPKLKGLERSLFTSEFNLLNAYLIQ